MATGDEILGKIDRAMWKVRSRDINNVTPFTYRDGLTYVDVLERLRSSVIDVIEFTNSFGEEQDKIIKRINEVVDNFITEMEKRHVQWDASVEEKRKALEDRMKEFESKVVSALFNTTNDENVVEAPTVGGGKIQVPSKKWQDRTISDLTQIRADTTTQLSFLKKSVDNDFYNKATSDKRYDPIHRVLYPHSLIIGSSNAESRGWPNGTWDRWVAAKGEIPHNYGYSGGGFTSTPDNNFNTQIDRAISDSVGDRAKLTGQIYVIDMLNDIRGKTDIRASATTFIKKVATNFPNAKVYVIPVLYNEHSLNNDWLMAMNCAAATNALKEVFEPYGALICEGSRSWFHNGKQARYFSEDSGVHFVTAGYEFAQRQFDNWLEGGSGWVDHGWYDLKGSASLDRVKNNANLQMYIARKEDIVHIHGMFSVGPLQEFLTMFNVPAWARPYRNMYIPAYDNTMIFPLIVDNTGALVPAARITTDKTFAVNGTYPIF